MEIGNIKELKNIQKERDCNTGYILNKESIVLDLDKCNDLSVGNYSNRTFDKYIKEAIYEMEKQIIKRAYELEEENYKKVERLAKIEAVRGCKYINGR